MEAASGHAEGRRSAKGFASDRIIDYWHACFQESRDQRVGNEWSGREGRNTRLDGVHRRPRSPEPEPGNRGRSSDSTAAIDSKPVSPEAVNESNAMDASGDETDMGDSLRGFESVRFPRKYPGFW